MKETDVLDMFRARVDNYTVSRIKPLRGRLYEVTMTGEHYIAVVLSDSFAYYELRYHLAQQKPTLVICYAHNTVLPIPVLSMRAGNFARAYELPEEIEDIEQQRHSKLGAHVILGMYLSGLRTAQTLVKSLPTSTRDRYLRKAKALGRRKRGRPVGRTSASTTA